MTSYDGYRQYLSEPTLGSVMSRGAMGVRATAAQGLAPVWNLDLITFDVSIWHNLSGLRDTGARVKARCLLVLAEASLSVSHTLSPVQGPKTAEVEL